MRKFKLNKEMSMRLAALSAAGLILVTSLTACKSKENTEGTNSTSIVAMVDDTENKLNTILPEANDEIIENASIILLLDVLAKENENGKINADLISQVKSKLDVDDMINEFNAFLDMIGFNAQDGTLEKVSEVLPSELENDKIILSKIETIVENIIKFSNEKNKDGVVTEFNKIYTLFVKEEEIEVDDVKFEIRDLSFASRAVATTYAEIAAYYSRDYISNDKYTKLDERTNDQNNKAYIRSKLEILSNQMEEKSEVDVKALFNKKYEEVSKLLDGKVKLENNTIKDLVNYINLKYLDGDKVSTKDKNEIVGEYNDEKVSEVLTAIEAINTYNLQNPSSLITYSSLLVDKYLATEAGKTDKVALDFVQFNTLKLSATTNKDTTYNMLDANPYFNNIYKYFTKQDFTHSQKSGDTEIVWQEISDGVNFINYQTILNSLNKLPNVTNLNNYKEVTQDNLGQSIQYLQNTISGECKKVDIKQYVK